MNETSSKEYSWNAMVKQVENAANNVKPPPKDVAYEFSNGRKFNNPGQFGGVYVP